MPARAVPRSQAGTMRGMRGPVCLVGSGEFTPVMESVDTALLAGRAQLVVFLPTAAAPEGAERTAYWVDLGLAHYRRLGVPAEALMVLARADAESEVIAERVAGAGLIYLSGGNPAYLASTLVGTPVADAINAAWDDGAAVAGCSAGAMALMESVPSIRGGGGVPVPGLGLVRGMAVIPHFDQLDRWLPGATDRAISATPPDVILVGIDEETAMVGDGERWTVMGRGAAWVLRTPDGPVRYGDGEVLPAPV